MFIQMLGYVEQARMNQKLMLTMFHMSSDYLIHGIRKINIKGDATIYRHVIARILKDDFTEHELLQLGCNLPQDAREIFQTIRKTIISPSHNWVGRVLSYLDSFDDQIGYALEYLKLKLVGLPKDPDTEAKLQSIQAKLQHIELEEGILDDWLEILRNISVGDIEEDGKDDLHVADELVLHDKQVDLTTVIKVDYLNRMRADGLLHVEEGTCPQVDEIALYIDETAWVEEDTTLGESFEMRGGDKEGEKDDIHEADESMLKILCLNEQVEWTTVIQADSLDGMRGDELLHIKEDTSPQVDKIDPQVDETAPQVVEETVRKVEEETPPQVDQAAPQVVATIDDKDGNTPKISQLSKIPLLWIIGCGVLLVMVLCSKATKSKHSKNTC